MQVLCSLLIVTLVVKLHNYRHPEKTKTQTQYTTLFIIYSTLLVLYSENEQEIKINIATQIHTRTTH